ncbi:glycosyl transferase family 8 protein [Cryptosporidium ryanae]|uniref:glycosyl transferase family 8 protein n=1 Tax=Cryptosporidium ryanae TaxID=515981 RepID=UPI00351A8D09|nr:glycosyl transferase family 8 protein [Cryptosporidium ryanae]
MTTKQKISLIFVLTSAVVCFVIPFITGLTSIKIFGGKNKFIFKSVSYAEANVITYDITLSSDKEVFSLFPTILNSIHSNLLEHEFANIHVITMPDVTKMDHSILLDMMEKLGFLKKLRIIFYPFKYNIKYKQTLKHVTQATMCRLLIPRILDSSINKLLYIDTDVIVNCPLRELFDIKIKSECGIVARSSTNSNLINEWLKKDGLSSHLHYSGKRSFNAGVLLIDLDKLRKNNFVEETLDVVQKWGINDQIALNLYCNGNYDELPVDYNFWAGRDDVNDIDKHKIVHFAGPNKPWKINYQPYQEQLLWYKYSLVYPQGIKATPPLRPTYILFIKQSSHIDDNKAQENSEVLIPESMLNDKLCRYMINIVAINYNGKNKIKLQDKLKEYSKKTWIEHVFVEMSTDYENNIGNMISKYILVKATQLFAEYVTELYLVINKIPEVENICKFYQDQQYKNIEEIVDTENGMNNYYYHSDENGLNYSNDTCLHISHELYKINLGKLRERREYIENEVEHGEEPSVIFKKLCENNTNSHTTVHI